MANETRKFSGCLSVCCLISVLKTTFSILPKSEEISMNRLPWEPCGASGDPPTTKPSGSKNSATSVNRPALYIVHSIRSLCALQSNLLYN